MVEASTLGFEINKGIIKLIPKGKNEDTVSGWHPITFLNSSYQIITKALVTRIKLVTKNIVRQEQTEFLGGRFILDNFILAWESIEWG